MDNNILTTKINDMEILRSYKTPEEEDKNIKADVTECKFVRWIPRGKNNDDTHLVCLVHHYPNGDAIKELKLIKNYKRPVWITRPIHRKYKDKKEFQKVENCDKILTTQSDLDKAVCKALDINPTPYNIQNIKDNPYLYGYEVPSLSILKHRFMKLSSNYLSDYKVVNLDIEFDVTGVYNDISIITLSMNGARHTAVLRRMFSKLYDTDEEIIKAIKEKDATDLPDSPAKQNTKIFNVTVHDNDLDLLKLIFSILHKAMPDFVTIHNMAYDIDRIMERLEYWNYPAGDLFCDPSIPKELRRVVYKKAIPFKIKKGVKKSIPMEEQWSSIDIVASFMIMDTMTGFAFVRQAAGKLVGGYSLQNLLIKHGCDGKLSYEDKHTKSLSKKDWHGYMSTYKPLEYTIYANQDTVGMTNLENQIEDFTQAIPVFAGISDYLRYNSSTHRAICNGYLENIDKGLIIGTTPKNPVDRSYLGTRGWIKTLSSDYIQEEVGLLITNIPVLVTNVTASADDMDCISSYPSDIQAGNISSGTTRAEILRVGTYSPKKFKDNNINIISSNANSVEYCNKMLGLPTLLEMRDLARKHYDAA